MQSEPDPSGVQFPCAVVLQSGRRSVAWLRW